MIRLRVVCGLSETMATLVPMMRLRSVDLPAFGRPMSETDPARGTLVAQLPPLHGRFLRATEADLVDAAALGLEDFDV